MLDEADGDMGVFCALVALRRTEWGGPGREFGILSVKAPTYADQLEIAGNTIRNQERRIRQSMANFPTRDTYGFFTDGYFKSLSQRYAPLGAENDPKGLNKNHYRNLVFYHSKITKELTDAIFGAAASVGPKE